MEGLYFLGIFSGNPPKADASLLNEPALWNVYLKKDKKIYIVQRLDQNNQATAEQYKISPAYFGINFRQVKNSSLKKTVDRQLKMLDTDKEKHESFFSSFFKNHSAFNSIFQQEKKKTNEFSFQMGTERQKKAAAEMQDETTHVKSLGKRQTKEFQFNVSDNAPDKAQKPQKDDFSPSSNLGKKQTNEFQFNVSDANSEPALKNQKDGGSFVHSANAPLPKELQINVSPKKNSGENAQNIDSSTEKYNFGNKETDQHPFDEKYSPERFGLDTILNSLNMPERQAVKTEKQPSFDYTNNYGLSSKQLNAETTLVHHKTGDEKNSSQTIDGDNVFFDSIIDGKQQPASAQNGTLQTKMPAGGDELLPAKGNANALGKSEKALKLDTALRREFQVSLHHWNMAKKNMALRNFRSIIYKEADFVPAHKHIFTEFAIQLRKINQHDLALVSAIRCTKLSPDDSHAFFNVARLYYELGKYEKANEFIDKTLILEPDLEPALRLDGIIKECLRRKAINK